MNTFNIEVRDISFTEENINSTQNLLIQNITTKNVVLTPLNSTITHIDDLFLMMYGLISAHHKKKIIKFRKRVKELDREYEKNNIELYNIVYNRNTENLLQSVHDSISVSLKIILH
jgi:hypothetical protein